MDILRLHRKLKPAMIQKRLKSKCASSLVETLVAMAIISIISLMLAEAVTVSVGFYARANDLRKEASAAHTALLRAASGDDEVNGVDHFTYVPESRFPEEYRLKINVYSYPFDNGEMTFYYCPSPNTDPDEEEQP